MALDQAELRTDPFIEYQQVTSTGARWFIGGLREVGRDDLPDLAKNYTSDSTFAGIIASRPDILISQQEITADNLGTKFDWVTGERPGKAHHELEGTRVNGRDDLLTTYNRGDTTGLFLIGAEGLFQLDSKTGMDFIARRKDKLQAATQYILDSLGSDDLFWDMPPPGATNYAIMSPYWKDTQLHQNHKKEPVYPVSFANAHFINARALLSASRLLDRPALATRAHDMFRAGIKAFIRRDGFTVYKDAEGQLDMPSSDELHSLAYIPEEYAPYLPMDAIKNRAESLATPIGFTSVPLTIGRMLDNRGHGDSVWPFEQALSHYAALKHKLGTLMVVAAGVAPHIGAGSERIRVEYDGATYSSTSVGNSRQLFSVAAAEYFAGKSILQETMWL